uniref:Uncharacterized protein n=1 Tax=Oryza sativa subsp. japonica TaxID=39947 RepID=Q7EYS0_ORYSJ|nr:hypothetical protein [Oryza sativa Japonica Group]
MGLAQLRKPKALPATFPTPCLPTPSRHHTQAAPLAITVATARRRHATSRPWPHASLTRILESRRYSPSPARLRGLAAAIGSAVRRGVGAGGIDFPLDFPRLPTLIHSPRGSLPLALWQQRRLLILPDLVTIALLISTLGTWIAREADGASFGGGDALDDEDEAEEEDEAEDEAEEDDDVIGDAHVRFDWSGGADAPLRKSYYGLVLVARNGPRIIILRDDQLPACLVGCSAHLRWMWELDLGSIVCGVGAGKQRPGMIKGLLLITLRIVPHGEPSEKPQNTKHL